MDCNLLYCIMFGNKINIIFEETIKSLSFRQYHQSEKITLINQSFGAKEQKCIFVAVCFVEQQSTLLYM